MEDGSIYQVILDTADDDFTTDSPLEGLLMGDANPNLPIPGRPVPLFFAVMNDKIKAVELLLRYGADPDGKPGEHGPPIVDAACRNMYTIVKLLLQHNADVNAIDGLGYTALHTAAEFGFLETSECLLGHPGIDMELKTLNHKATALNSASASHNLPLVELFVQHGCEVNTVDILGNTPLHYQAINGCERGVELLLQSGALPDVKNKAAATPLWYAVYEERASVCTRLLRCDVDLSAASSGLQRGRGSRKNMVFNIYHRAVSLLWVAVQRNSPDIVDILLDGGLDIHNESWILTHYYTTENTDSKLQTYLTHLILSPQSLFKLSKNTLFKHFGRSLSKLPSNFNLPDSLRNRILP